MIPFRGGRQLSSGHRNGLGSGFGGAIAYLLHGRRDAPVDIAERVAWTRTRNLPVQDPENAAWYMRQWANQRGRTEKPVYHFGASLAPGEHLAEQQWNEVAERMLTALGLEDHQAVLALHHDRDHEHLHIVANRVGPDPNLPAWRPQFDSLTLQRVAREVERDFGLRVVPTLRDKALEAKKDAGIPRREKEQPFARKVSDVALEHFGHSRGWKDLELRLAKHGLRLEPAKRGGGVNITDGEHSAGVARLDRTLSGPRLAERFGESLRNHRQSHPTHPDLARSFSNTGGVPETPTSPAIRGEAILDRLSKQATFTFAQVNALAQRGHQAEETLRHALESPRVVALGQGRFALRDYVELEERLFYASTGLAADSTHRLDTQSVEARLRAYPMPLSTEQQRAVHHAATQRDLALVVGRSGAGKTRMTQPLAELYSEAGYRVLGAAPTGTAAQKLGEDASIESRTLASYFYSWGQNRDELASTDVLLVDEASMIPVADMARLLEHVRDQGAKLVLVGDPGQLPPIGAGDAFRGLIHRHRASELRTIYRQADDWQRRASEDLARGEFRASLNTYAENGRVEWHHDRQQAQQALVHQYFEDRYFAPDSSSLILARRRAEVRRINTMIREARINAGELGEGIRVNRRHFAPGDRLLFRRNDNTARYVLEVDPVGAQEGIRNGDLGTLLSADASRFHVRLDNGRKVEFDPTRYTEIAHGYAATVHTSQGRTIDRVYVLPDEGFRREMTYVALTRHRHHLTLFLDRQTFPDLGSFQSTASRSETKDLVSDYRPVESPSLPAPPPAPTAIRAAISGDRYPSPPPPTRSSSSARSSTSAVPSTSPADARLAGEITPDDPEAAFAAAAARHSRERGQGTPPSTEATPAVAPSADQVVAAGEGSPDPRYAEVARLRLRAEALDVVAPEEFDEYRILQREAFRLASEIDPQNPDAVIAVALSSASAPESGSVERLVSVSTQQEETSVPQQETASRHQLADLLSQRSDSSGVNDISRREQQIGRMARALDPDDPNMAIDAAYQEMAKRNPKPAPVGRAVRYAQHNAGKAHGLVENAQLDSDSLASQRSALMRAERSLRHAYGSLAHQQATAASAESTALPLDASVQTPRTGKDSPHRLAQARVLLEEARSRFTVLEHRRAALRLITPQATNSDPHDLSQAVATYYATAPELLTPDPPLQSIRLPSDLFSEPLHAASPEPLQRLFRSYEERIDHHRTQALDSNITNPDSLARALRHHDAAELLSQEIPHLTREASQLLYLRDMSEQHGAVALWRLADTDDDLRWLTRADPNPPIWEQDHLEAGDRILKRLQDDLSRRLSQVPTLAQQVTHIQTQTQPLLEQAEKPNEPPRTGNASVYQQQLADPPRSASPAQIERLRKSLERLEQWDRIESRLSRLSLSREDLPHLGSEPDLSQAIRDVPRPLASIRQHAPGIYRHPESALSKLDAALEADRSAALRSLAAEPQKFGRLRGSSLAGVTSKARNQALSTVRVALAEVATNDRHRADLHQALRSHRNLADYESDLRAQQQRLAPNRDRLLATVAKQSGQLRPSALRANLTASQAQTLERLHNQQRRLEPLRQVARQSLETLKGPTRRVLALLQRPLSERGQLTAAATQALKSLHQLSKLVRQGPRFLIYRLSPPQIGVALAVAKLGHRLTRDPDHAQDRPPGLAR